MSPRKKKNTGKDDNKKSNFIKSNLSFLRSEYNKTLDEMSELLGLSGKSSYRAYENGDAVPSVHILMKLASFYDVSLDELVRFDLSKKETTNIKTIDEPEVPVVPIKARAGYVSGFQDDHFIDNLQTIKIPYKPYGITRAFQIDGNSMEPEVNDGAYVVGIKIDQNELQSGKNYIVVTDDGDIVYKMVIENQNSLNLISRNPKYPAKEVDKEKIKEMWKYYCHLNKT